MTNRYGHIRPQYNKSYDIVDGNNLMFKHAELSQAGIYRCHAILNYRELPAVADVIILGKKGCALFTFEMFNMSIILHRKGFLMLSHSIFTLITHTS